MLVKWLCVLFHHFSDPHCQRCEWYYNVLTGYAECCFLQLIFASYLCFNLHFVGAPCALGEITLPLVPSLPHLLICFLVFFTFSFLTRFIYILAFPSLPILPEQSHSVSRPDVVEGDWTWLWVAAEQKGGQGLKLIYYHWPSFTG